MKNHRVMISYLRSTYPACADALIAIGTAPQGPTILFEDTEDPAYVAIVSECGWGKNPHPDPLPKRERGEEGAKAKPPLAKAKPPLAKAKPPLQKPIPLTARRAVHGAAGLAKAALGIGRASEETIAQRRALCEACPNLLPNRFGIKSCQLCGCGYRAKIANASESCPDKPARWGAE